jgi:hypothetical protein
MAAELAVVAEPALAVVLEGVVTALAAHGFTREPGAHQVTHHADEVENQLHVVLSCTVTDAAAEQRLSVVVTYILAQARQGRKPEVTGKVYMVVGLVGQVPVDRYDRSNALGAGMFTPTSQMGCTLQSEQLADSVALLAKECGPGARELTKCTALVARVLVRKLEP